MGERTVRIRKVKGSNPSVSTNEKDSRKAVFFIGGMMCSTAWNVMCAVRVMFAYGE